MYYVRKLSRPAVLQKLQNISDVNELYADFLGQDMRTSDNQLSVWRSETLEGPDIDRAINAALLACSQINVCQFLIIDSDALSSAEIRTDDTQPGITGYMGLENLHTNLCDLTYEKIGKLVQIYREICQDETRTLKVDKGVFKEVIHKAKEEGALNISILTGHMKKEVMALLGINSQAPNCV